MPATMRKSLWVVLAGVLLGATASGAMAATATAGSPPVTKWRVGDIPAENTELDELDEVLVWGRRATVLIADLEDDYYKRYNKLNKDKRYDVHCSYINTDPDNPGSALRSRICMPEFVIDAMVDWAQGRCEIPDFTSLDLNKDNVLSEAEAAGNKQLLDQVFEMDTNRDRRITFVEFLERPEAVNPVACYQPPSPEQVLMAGTDKWYAQMMKVTSSDPQLLEMASNLGTLYGQLRVLEKQAVKLEARELAKKVSTERRAPR
jgi:hypothetical protein